MVDLCRRIHSNVQQLRATLQEEAPGKLEELGTSLSELADGERPLPGCGRGQESPKDGSDPYSESTDTEGSVASSDEASKEFVKEYQKRKRAGSNSASGSGSGSDEASHISGPLRVVATVDSRA